MYKSARSFETGDSAIIKLTAIQTVKINSLEMVGVYSSAVRKPSACGCLKTVVRITHWIASDRKIPARS